MNRSFASALLLLVVSNGIAKADHVNDRPVLVLDPLMHTAPVKDVAIDAGGKLFATSSHDKTVRIWSTANGALVRTIYMPAGVGHVGELSSIAISHDGALLAVGGFGDYADEGTSNTGSLYIINAESGTIEKRLLDTPGTVVRVAFSPDDRYLAASLAEKGLFVFAKGANWEKPAADFRYSGGVYGLAFAPDGQSLATASDDGMVRLYQPGPELTPKRVYRTNGPPGHIAFSPDGKVLAIGYDNAPRVDLVDALTFERLQSPVLEGLRGGALDNVTWSADGRTLYAGGSYQDEGRNRVILAWNEGGHGTRRALRAKCDDADIATNALASLGDGRLLVVKGFPCFVMLKPNGEVQWTRQAPGGDFRAPPGSGYRNDTFRVSHDGKIVDFDFQQTGTPLRFDVSKLTLYPQPASDGVTATAPQNRDEQQQARSASVGLDPGEKVMVVGSDPTASGRFVAGSDFRLRGFAANGAPLWENPALGPVWAANITGDGQVVVAAYSDGTIRWRRMADGRELLALFVASDKTNWVAWTPVGFFQATPGARDMVKFQYSRADTEVASTRAVSDFPNLDRPDAIRTSLDIKEPESVPSEEAVKSAHIQIKDAFHSTNCPGPRLHYISIGINQYGPGASESVLHYAIDDARDFALKLKHSQRGCRSDAAGLYAGVDGSYLIDKTATKAEIISSIQALGGTLQPEDTVVFFYSGHGEVINNYFYFITYGTDPSTEASMQASSLSAGDLERVLEPIKKRAQLLMLIDACHSGAALVRNSLLSVDNDLLRQSAVPPNVAIITSSEGKETSAEDDKLKHGFFTKAILEALDGNGPHDGNVIYSSQLAHYIVTRVDALTKSTRNPQHPHPVLYGDPRIFTIDR